MRNPFTSSALLLALLGNAVACARGEEIARLRAGKEMIIATCFLPDGRRVVTGGMDGVVRLWDARKGEQLKQFEGHQDDVVVVAAAPRGATVFSGSADGTVRAWDVESGKALHRIRAHGVVVQDLAVSPDGLTLAITDFQGRRRPPAIRLFDLRTMKETLQLTGPELDGFDSVAFSPDGRHVAALAVSSAHPERQDRVYLWDAQSGKRLRIFEGLTPASITPSPSARTARAS
jgi:WD40 repeat protein